MQHFKYVIIGGGIAGTTAAETIRKNDREGSMALVSDELYPLYSRVMLSKPAFMRGEQSFESVWLKKSEWYEQNAITFIGGVSATSLDGSVKKVVLSDGREIEYEKLLLSIGAHARKWTISGSDKKGIYYLRGLDDTKAIIEALKTKKKAVLIGSGCVSFEIADVLHSLGIETTLVMREKHFSEPMLSEQEGKMIEKKLEENGVKIIRNMEITEVLGNEESTGVVLKDGTTLDCDIILCMIGVIFPTEWLKTSGIMLGRGIVANEFLETSIPDVWTAGDIAEYTDTVLKETFLCGNWMNSRGQGETAALGMIGQRKEYQAVTFQTSHGFGDVIGFVGDTRALPERKILYRGSPEQNSFARLIVQDHRLIGATLINRLPEMGTITKFIKEGTDISGREEEIGKSEFDLKTLISLAN
ncbi:MAG: FAD-dependent oxidoreductase [Candidatus Parcubacteria bacterium]|nr:FAD-dependent oxidoreductase [Candidatus Parcubacteria bacterium]